MEIITDSATVRGWLESVISDSHRIRSHGIGEMLIKRRLGMVEELRCEYDLNISVKLVPSSANKADILTRVPKEWLADSRMICSVAVSNESKESTIKRVHSEHHFGASKTLHLAKLRNVEISRDDDQSVVDQCDRCRSIDPAPI